MDKTHPATLGKSDEKPPNPLTGALESDNRNSMIRVRDTEFFYIDFSRAKKDLYSHRPKLSNNH